MPESNEVLAEAIRLREESLRELLSRPPSWILRWGGLGLVLILGLMLALAWWIRYPDLIVAPVRLSTLRPPVPVMSQKAGVLQRIMVADQEKVEAGQTLAILQSTAKVEDVFALEAWLRSLGGLNPDSLLNPLPRQFWQLGDLQGPYADFLQSLEYYQLYLLQNSELQQIPFLQADKAYLQSLNLALNGKDSILEAELRLAEGNYQRQEAALQIGGNIPEKVEQVRVQILRTQAQRQDLRAQVLDNKLRINGLENRITDIRLRSQEGGQSRYIQCKEQLQRLQAALQTWLQAHLLRAPIAGRVAFIAFWSEQQYVNADTEVFTLVPETGAIRGRLFLPVVGSGKVERGQNVLIKLHAFPYREYGLIEGEVASIALVAKDQGLLVDIALPQDLKTSYGKDLPFYQDMLGQAEIVTKDRRLLERFFSFFLKGQ